MKMIRIVKTEAKGEITLFGFGDVLVKPLEINGGR